MIVTSKPSEAPRASAEGRPRTYRLKEYGFTDVPLADLMEGQQLSVDPAVAKNDYFTLQMQGDRLRLQARGWIGLIPLNERVVIDVRPRVSVSNFTRILEVAGHTPAVLANVMRSYALENEWSDSLLDLYAQAFVSQVREIELRGFYREYEQREEQTSFPRGRILQGQTAAMAARGLSHVAAASWFERTVDTPINRCLKYAAWFLGQRYTSLGARSAASRRIHRELNVLYGLFDGVGLDRSLRFLEEEIVIGRQRLPALRAYYRPALETALAIIRQHAIRIDEPGPVELPSLVLKMDEVFEAYCRNVLKSYAHTDGWQVDVVDGRKEPPAGGGKPLFDQPGSNQASPDIVVRKDEPTSYPALIEVKYKPAAGPPERGALNQAITYAASYRSNHVVVVQPRASATSPAGLYTLGTIADLTVHQYVVDLDASDLAAEEQAFGKAVGELGALSG